MDKRIFYTGWLCGAIGSAILLYFGLKYFNVSFDDTFMFISGALVPISFILGRLYERKK